MTAYAEGKPDSCGEVAMICCQQLSMVVQDRIVQSAHQSTSRGSGSFVPEIYGVCHGSTQSFVVQETCEYFAGTVQVDEHQLADQLSLLIGYGVTGACLFAMSTASSPCARHA